MGFLNSSTTFSRFRITDPVPQGLWLNIPGKLKLFAIQDIDETTEERSFGWTNFDDLLDTSWSMSIPEKADYLVFSLRLDTRRIPPAVLKKHTKLAIQEEESKIKIEGKGFITRSRKKELHTLIRIKLMTKFLPIPAEFNVVWNTRTNIIYFASAQSKVLQLFSEYFTKTFELDLELMTPYTLAAHILGDDAGKQLDKIEASHFA